MNDTVLVEMPREDFEACDLAFSRPWRIIERDDRARLVDVTLPDAVQVIRADQAPIVEGDPVTKDEAAALRWIATAPLAALRTENSVPLADLLPLLREVVRLRPACGPRTVYCGYKSQYYEVDAERLQSMCREYDALPAALREAIEVER